MDTKSLIADAKMRFSHNSAKAQLKDKYDSKLVVAVQGGLWKADVQTISLLSAVDTETIVLIDSFENPVKVNRIDLLQTLLSLYTTVMNEWYLEWAEVETKR